MSIDPRLDPTSSEAARWYLACTIEERAAGAPRGDKAAAARGRAVLDSWSESGGVAPHVIERWIEAVGCATATVHAVLGEVPEAFAQRAQATVPGWLSELCAALDANAADNGTLAPWIDAPANAPLLACLEPLLIEGMSRLREGLSNLNGLPEFGDESQLLAPIRLRLLKFIERACIVELHAARLQGQLASDDDAAAFTKFAQHLATHDGRVTFLLEYPVLARTALRWVNQWHDGVLELATAVVDDAGAIAQVFGTLGTRVTLTASDSDPHRGGRHVWFVDSESGNRIVFKPRPFAVEGQFQNHIAQLNELGLTPPLPTLRVVSRADHGWMQHAAHRDASSSEAVHVFHHQQGQWLMVLWSLACTDMHFENTIAIGDTSVPIDHETLLRSHIFDPDTGAARTRAEFRLAATIMGVDLLPAPQDDSGFDGPIDQGGMGSGYTDAGEIVIDRVLDEGSAAMRVGPGRIDPGSQPNRVTVNGAPVDARQYGPDVERGITDAWRVLAEHRDQLCTSLDVFSNATVRCILRPTQMYLDVLEMLSHPWYLGSAIEREHALMNLFMYPEDHAWRAQTTPHERRQILVGDVPWFGARAGEHDLLSGDGITIAGGIAQSGLDIARDRHREDLAGTVDDHLWVARTSLAQWGRGQRVAGVGAGAGINLQAGDAADLIAERLHHSATISGDHATWFGITTVSGRAATDIRFRPTIIKGDIYDGTAGIAMFLAAHGRLRDNAVSRDLAHQAVRATDERLADERARIGAYDGAGGMMWMNLLVASLLDDSSAIDRAEAEAAALAVNLESDQVYDIVSGAAGVIPVLIELARHRPDALSLAIRYGDRLIEQVTQPTSLGFARGFSHGATGIAWALGSLANATGEQRFAEHATHLVRAEDQLLQDGHWNEDAHGAPFHAWCHGALGIALGRMHLRELLGDAAAGDPQIAADAMHVLRAAPVHDSHGLCHGELGTVELLEDVALITGDTSLMHEADRRRHTVLADISRHGVACTMPRCLEVPGVMTGLAGIGWSMLRATAPGELPSLLLPGSVLTR